jgi:hypothetical protein
MEKPRRLTVPMIRRLFDGLGLPATVLIQKYALRKQWGNHENNNRCRQQRIAHRMSSGSA